MTSPHWKTVALLSLGILAGMGAARLLAAPSARAQAPAQLRECMALSLHWHDGAAFANPAWRPTTIAIRPGWTVVGGAGAQPYAVVCR